MSSSTRSRADSPAGRPTTESGHGAMRSWSGSVAVRTRTVADTTTSTMIGPKSSSSRSRDGGMTWSVEQPRPPGALAGTPGMRHGLMPPDYPEERPMALDTPIDFSRPGFAMTLRMENSNNGVSR